MRAHLALAALLSWDDMAETREVLRKSYKLKLPASGSALTAQDWADLLAEFLRWLKANLNGQTSLPVHALWATQSAVLQGFGQFSLPDLVAREDRLAEDLSYLAQSIGAAAPPFEPAPADTASVKLAEIWSAALEQAAQDAYSRDYLHFGFRGWKG